MSKPIKVLLIVFLLYVFSCVLMLLKEYSEIENLRTTHFEGSPENLKAVEILQNYSNGVTSRVSSTYIAVPWLEKSGWLTNAPFPHRAKSLPHERIRYSAESLKREPEFWLPTAILVPFKGLMIFCGGLPFMTLILLLEDRGRRISGVLKVLTFVGTIGGLVLYINISKQIEAFYLARVPLSQEGSNLEFVFGSGNMPKKLIIVNSTEDQVLIYVNDCLVGHLRGRAYDYFSVIHDISTITVIVKSTGTVMERNALVPPLTSQSPGYYLYNLQGGGSFWVEKPPDYIVLPGL